MTSRSPSEAASTRDACDVCSGRTSVADSKVTCSEHFIQSLDDPHQGRGETRTPMGLLIAHARSRTNREGS